ncbi:SCO2400 family protein [Streptomyces sp. QTS52]
MDYCSTCCRHLNGALVCPGCGAYAPDIAPLTDETPAPATATDASTRPAPVHLWNDADSGAEEAGQLDQPSQGQPDDNADVPSPAPQGRAARRRQRARWKKTQRKALVATAVALVGGGMTVASLNRQAPDRTQAASAPDREPMGVTEGQITDPTPVSSTPTDTHRARRTSSAARTSTTNAPHEQAAGPPRATPTAQVTDQKSVTVPLAAVTASTESQAAASNRSGATDTASETMASPAPSATDSTTTSGTDTSSATPSPSESSSTPTSTAASSSGLCLLGLVCIS